MKAIYLILLVVGLVLALGTESLNATSNILGVALAFFSCDKLNLFNRNYV